MILVVNCSGWETLTEK